MAAKLVSLQAKLCASMKRLDELDSLARMGKSNPVSCITALKDSVPMESLDLKMHECGLERSARLRLMSPVIERIKEERARLIASRQEAKSNQAHLNPPSPISHVHFGDVSVINPNASVLATPTHLPSTRSVNQVPITHHTETVDQPTAGRRGASPIRSQSSADVMRAIAMAAAGGKRVFLDHTADHRKVAVKDNKGDNQIHMPAPGGLLAGVMYRYKEDKQRDRAKGNINTAFLAKPQLSNKEVEPDVALIRESNVNIQQNPQSLIHPNGRGPSRSISLEAMIGNRDTGIAKPAKPNVIAAPVAPIRNASVKTQRPSAPIRRLAGPAERAERARANRMAAAASAAGAVKSLRRLKPETSDGSPG